MMPDRYTLGKLYLDWEGYGSPHLKEWPPKLIVKPRVKGFEMPIYVERMRDTSAWEGGRCQGYMHKTILLDIDASTTVKQIRDCIENQVRIPAHRFRMVAILRRNYFDFDMVELDEDDET